MLTDKPTPGSAAGRAVVTGSMIADEVRQRRRNREQSRATLLDLLGNWCPASGSEDEYRVSDHMDTVQCGACQRWLYLTRQCRLPRHKREVRRAN